MKVKILKKNRLIEDFFSMDEVELQHLKSDGKWSDPMRRLNLYRGEAAAVLIYVADTDQFVLVNQFRYAVYENDEPGWIDEIVAGVFDDGDSPEGCARREAIEESGFVLDKLEKIGCVYVSPGITNERIHLFAGVCKSSDRQHEGGGIPHEHEDIVVKLMKREDVYNLLDTGKLVDGKTILALQYFRLHEQRLLEKNLLI